MIASIVTNPDELSELINIEPFKEEEDKKYYYLSDVKTTFIKGAKDGSATFIMPYKEEYLKIILEEFILYKFEMETIENQDNTSNSKLFISNSKIFFVIYRIKDDLIIFGMEHSKVPK